MKKAPIRGGFRLPAPSCHLLITQVTKPIGAWSGTLEQLLDVFGRSMLGGSQEERRTLGGSWGSGGRLQTPPSTAGHFLVPPRS